MKPASHAPVQLHAVGASPVHGAVGRPPRHRLAVVIGSGGVRSIAGLGMIEALREAGLAPDLIVGCSAGAIFGALAAAGHRSDEALRLATTLWTAEITRTPRRLALARMAMPRIGGFDEDFAMRDDTLVMQRLRAAFGDTRLEDLCTPLRVTATDAGSGQTVQLRRGPLVQALRASVALPFMFAPEVVDGRRLIDGFLTDPLPVGAALDAELIVALGVEAPLPARVDRPARLLARVTSTMTNSLMHARVAAARGAGARVLTVMPTLPRRVGLFDTEAMPDLVALGRQATQAVLSEVLRAAAAAAVAAPAAETASTSTSATAVAATSAADHAPRLVA